MEQGSRGRMAPKGVGMHIIPSQRVVEEYRAGAERFGSEFVMRAVADVLNERELRELEGMISDAGD
jgi:cytochrome c553